MENRAALPSFSAIIVAAGQGRRAGGELPKQYRQFRGKPLLRHSLEKLLAQGAQEVVIAIGPGQEQLARECLEGIERVRLVEGGETRQQSVANALEALGGSGCTRILIHDAARPDLPSSVTRNLLQKLEEFAGAIPVLPVVDSLALADGDTMAGSAERDKMRRVQTPQAFRFDRILAAHRAWQGDKNAGDDAQVLTANGGKVGLVEGDERLAKLTFAHDFDESRGEMRIGELRIGEIRIGQGFDVHRLAGGEELWLCGLKIPHDKGLAGHSDADVALHALVDALLGALGEGDIGSHFPPGEAQWRGAASSRFVEHARGLMQKRGFSISNLDLTLICEAPKIGPHRAEMRARLAELLQTDIARISVKATTTEGLGFTGRSEGIAAQAVVCLQGSGSS